MVEGSLTLTTALALTGTGLAGVFLLPQIRRLVVAGDTSGVSPAWAAFGVVTNSAWILYLVAQRLWVPALAPALAVLTYGSLLAVMGRIGFGDRWAVPVTAYTGSLTAVALVAGLDGLAVVLVLTPVVQIMPEVGAVFRHASLWGVSPATWLLGMGEAVCWGWFGLLVGDGALVGYGVVTGVGSAVILVRWWTVCGNRLLRTA